MAEPLQELAETIRTELKNIGLDIPIANIVNAIHNLSSQTFEVTQDTAADLLATVTQDAKDRYNKIPDNASQIAVRKLANNSTEILHTVTTGKTLYLTAWTFTIDALATGDGILRVRNASDVAVYEIVYTSVRIANERFGLSDGFSPPLEIPAGYDVVVTSSASNCFVSGFIHGYEV